MAHCTCVELSSDVYQVCLTHALSTEKEEVMGLLMGEVRETIWPPLSTHSLSMHLLTLTLAFREQSGSYLFSICHASF